MRNVDSADHVDARVQQRLNVLPSLGVIAGPVHTDVRVGELVDQRHLWPTGQYRRQVEFGERCAPILHGCPRDHREAVQLGGGVRPAMRFDVRDDDIRPSLSPPVTLVQHGVSLSDARRSAEVDAEPAWCHHPSSPADAAIGALQQCAAFSSAGARTQPIGAAVHHKVNVVTSSAILRGVCAARRTVRGASGPALAGFDPESGIRGSMTDGKRSGVGLASSSACRACHGVPAGCIGVQRGPLIAQAAQPQSSMTKPGVSI